MTYALQEAWDDLEDPGRYLGTDNARAAYARVLGRLPVDIRHFALERCFVVCVGRELNGMTWPLSMIDKRQRRWLIVCGEDNGLEDRIAHEIAHATRGDQRHELGIEKAADDLAVAWGFQRSYPMLGC